MDTNQIMKKKRNSLTNQYLYQIKSQKTTMDWVKSIKGDDISRYLSNNFDGFMTRIKRTKVNQIKYNIEELDEQNRRLKKAVNYVQFCNEKLMEILEDEKKSLESFEMKIDNLNSCNKGRLFFSINFVRNLERELCQLQNDINEKNKEIEVLKNSTLFFEYKENIIFINSIDEQIMKLKEEEMTVMEKDKNDFIEKKKKNKIEIEEYENRITKIFLKIKKFEDAEKRKKFKKRLVSKRLLKINKASKNGNFHNIDNKIINFEKDIKKLKNELKKKNNKKENQNSDLFLSYILIYLKMYNLDYQFLEEIFSFLENSEEKTSFIVNSFDLNESVLKKDFCNFIVNNDFKSLIDNVLEYEKKLKKKMFSDEIFKNFKNNGSDKKIHILDFLKLNNKFFHLNKELLNFSKFFKSKKFLTNQKKYDIDEIIQENEILIIKKVIKRKKILKKKLKTKSIEKNEEVENKKEENKEENNNEKKNPKNNSFNSDFENNSKIIEKKLKSNETFDCKFTKEKQNLNIEDNKNETFNTKFSQDEKNESKIKDKKNETFDSRFSQDKKDESKIENHKNEYFNDDFDKSQSESF